jgi:ribosome production factor 1
MRMSPRRARRVLSAAECAGLARRTFPDLPVLSPPPPPPSPSPSQVPRTIESTREFDETAVAPDDAEVLGDEADDEFARIWSGEEAPKLMVTTQRSPSGKLFPVIAELLGCIPNAFYYKRGLFDLKRICTFAADKGFTHLLVLTERLKVPNGLLVIRLPFGPTAAFKLRSTMLASDIKGHGRSTGHVPELILNNFGTRLGRRVGRVLGSLFPHKPEFVGRQVATFHNQRDFIFFRHHRYIFEEVQEGGGEERARKAGIAGGVRVRMQELGPRFTLRLKYLLAGSFDTKFGDYEWRYHRHDMETSRRRFQL